MWDIIPRMTSSPSPVPTSRSTLVLATVVAVIKPLVRLLWILVGLVAVLLAMSGGGSLLDTLGSNMMAIAGVALGATLIAAVLGWVIGRKS